MFEQRKIENVEIRKNILPIINKYESEIVGKYEAPEAHNKFNKRMVRRLKRILFISRWVW